MIFPPQTSLMPVAVALARFWESNNFSQVYPFWYLGTPFRYLTGPVVPGLLVLLSRLTEKLSYFDWSYGLLLASFVFAAYGWGRLAALLSGERKTGWLVALLFLVTPWKWFFALTEGETSVIIGLNLLPAGLILIGRYFTQKSYKRLVVCSLFLALIWLVNVTILPSVLIGALALITAQSGGENVSRRKWWEEIKTLGKLFLGALIISLVLATVWYTPGFWMTILRNPSIGGANIFGVVLRLGGMARAFLPAVLGAAAVLVLPKIRRTAGLVFGLTWGGAFLFLTIFRFLANPVFWQDYTTWFFELEIGLALVFASIGWRLRLVFLGLSLLASIYFYGRLGRPEIMSAKPPVMVAGLKAINKLTAGKAERVFLSGSPVFWADSLYDINQVRGGNDGAATHPLWNMAAYQIREGTSPSLTQKWLRVLGVSYVLVHGRESSEHYHDFRNMQKWEELGGRIYSENGDFIYAIENSGMAWQVDEKKLAAARLPHRGDDEMALESYLAAFGKKVAIKQLTNGWQIETEGGSDILLLVTDNTIYKVRSELGRSLEVKRDAYGQMLIKAAGAMEVVVTN